MRLMYDSITATDIPLSARMVAGYVDGPFRWKDSDWSRFPNSVRVGIATRVTTNDGHVGDVENGDMTPAQAVTWVLMRRAAGTDPTLYCNELNGWTAVIQAFRTRNVPEPHYWVAHYNGIQAIPGGAIAKQYANPPVHQQGHFDLSVVADYWPGVDPPLRRTMEAADVVTVTAPGDRSYSEPQQLKTLWGDTYFHTSALAKTDIPALRSEVARLQASIDGLRAQLDHLIAGNVRIVPTGEITVKAIPTGI
jgi:hypothetical protein